MYTSSQKIITANTDSHFIPNYLKRVEGCSQADAIKSEELDSAVKKINRGIGTLKILNDEVKRGGDFCKHIFFLQMVVKDCSSSLVCAWAAAVRTPSPERLIAVADEYFRIAIRCVRAMVWMGYEQYGVNSVEFNYLAKNGMALLNQHAAWRFISYRSLDSEWMSGRVDILHAWLGRSGINLHKSRSAKIHKGGDYWQQNLSFRREILKSMLLETSGAEGMKRLEIDGLVNVVNNLSEEVAFRLETEDGVDYMYIDKDTGYTSWGMGKVDCSGVVVSRDDVCMGLSQCISNGSISIKPGLDYLGVEEMLNGLPKQWLGQYKHCLIKATKDSVPASIFFNYLGVMDQYRGTIDARPVEMPTMNCIIDRVDEGQCLAFLNRPVAQVVEIGQLVSIRSVSLDGGLKCGVVKWMRWCDDDSCRLGVGIAFLSGRPLISMLKGKRPFLSGEQVKRVLLLDSSSSDGVRRYILPRGEIGVGENLYDIVMSSQRHVFEVECSGRDYEVVCTEDYGSIVEEHA